MKKPKRIMLLNPHFNGTVYAPAMGLGFLGTYIKKKLNSKIDIYDPIIHPLDRTELLKKIKDYDFLGMTCFTEARFECFDFAKDAKRINPKIKIVIGGPHTIGLDTMILEHYPYVDFIVLNEGEESFLEILKGENPLKILGITWRDNNGKIIKNADRPLSKDISQYKYDYSLIKGIDEWKDGEVEISKRKLIHAPIIVSRGCPYRCSFCGSFNQWRCRYRTIEPKKVVDLIESLMKKRGIEYFRFYDALFMGSNEKLIEFAKEILKRKLKVEFRIDLRANTNEEALILLKKAGCIIAGFGIESGSDKVLKRINKGTSHEMIVKVLKSCRKEGYWTIGYFMVSLPDETKEDMKITFDLFKYVDVFNLQFFKLHPGTPLYDELKSRKMIDDSVWFDPNEPKEIYHSNERFATAKYSKKEIDWIMISAFYKFCIMHPWLIYARHGLIKGSFYVFGSLIDLPLKGFLHRNLYEKINGKN